MLTPSAMPLPSQGGQDTYQLLANGKNYTVKYIRQAATTAGVETAGQSQQGNGPQPAPSGSP